MAWTDREFLMYLEKEENKSQPQSVWGCCGAGTRNGKTWSYKNIALGKKCLSSSSRSWSGGRKIVEHERRRHCHLCLRGYQRIHRKNALKDMTYVYELPRKHHQGSMIVRNSFCLIVAWEVMSPNKWFQGQPLSNVACGRFIWKAYLVLCCRWHALILPIAYSAQLIEYLNHL